MQEEKFPFLKEYAAYILQNHLTEATAANLKIADELKLSLSNMLPHLDKNQIFEYYKNNLRNFLIQLKEDTALHAANETLRKWKADEIPGIRKQVVQVEDIIRNYSARKQVFLNLLLKYTENPQKLIAIVTEIEKLHAKLEELAFAVFVDIKQEELMHLNFKLKEYQEELQASHEELLESHEEIQVSNEELKGQIGKRAAIEKALEKESDFLRAVLENVSDGIVACNEHGVLSFFNDATRNFHGLPELAMPAEEWANYYHLYHPDGKTLLAKEDIPLFKAYRGETVKDIEMVIEPVTGNKRKLLATGRQIISSEGKNMGAVVVMHDITKQKEAEKEIYEKNKELAQALEELQSTDEQLIELNNELEQRVHDRTNELSASEEELRQTLENAVELNKTIAEREIFLSGIIDQTPVSTTIFDAEGMQIKVNEASLKLFGVEDANLGLGKYNILKDNILIAHPHFKDIQAVFTEGKIARIEMEYDLSKVRHVNIPTSSPINIVATVFPIKDARGKVVNVVAQHEDITQRKTAEKALSDNEHQLRLITDALPVLISYVDTEEKYLFNNKAYEEWFNRRREDMYGMNIEEAIGREAYLSVRDYVQEALAGKEVYYEAQMNYKGAGKRYVSTSFIPHIINGKVMGFYTLVNNITERKKAEDDLHESEARLQFALNTAQLGDWDMDIATGKARRSLLYDQIFGYGSPLPAWDYDIFIKHIHPEDRQQVNEKFQWALTNNTKWDFEARIIHFDGSIHWIWGKGDLYRDRDGQASRMIGVVQDITARKKAEEELRLKNDELLKINTDLDNFVYTASHDLKSPISNIEGLALILNKKLDSRMEDSEKKLMGMIGQSILKFKSTINDLTEIAKVQKNLEYEMEEIAFQGILENVKADIQEMIIQSAALIKEDLQEGSVTYARHNLRSILYNLLSNAIKYRSSKRPLKININTYKEGKHVVLSVEDNGLGMSQENLPKLFNMFKRLHTHVEGTGIGLYMIKRIIENKGGRIEVESKLDAGSIFRVYFISNI